MLSTVISLGPIDKAEALRYMGFGETMPDESFIKRVETIESELIKSARPRYIWRVFSLSYNQSGILYADDSIALTGEAISEHLEGCTEAVLMAATLSSQADMLISRAGARSMTDALIVDALASAGIEQVCNKAELMIGQELENKYMTWRFSPGYGDLPLDLQEEFITALDAQRKIGLTVTDSSILIPTKSVTAVIGISDKPLKKRQQGCAFCNMRDRCQFRRKGVHCGNA